MEVAGNKRRKRRFTPEPTAQPLRPTALLLRLLGLIGRCGLLTVPQLARLAGISEQAVRRQLRPAFDHGLVHVVVVPKLAVAEGSHCATALAFGSAPNAYQLLRPGARLLVEAGEPAPVLLRERIGPRQWLFLSHELGVRDTLAWMAACARHQEGHQLLRWELGAAAAIVLENGPAVSPVRPDLWLTYAFPGHRLGALVEYDRATERGERAWQGKLRQYARLLAGMDFARVSGVQYGRVLVVTTQPARRDSLAALIDKEAPGWLKERFYVAGRTVLDTPDLTQVAWRRPGQMELQPLVPPALLAAEAGSPEPV